MSAFAAALLLMAAQGTPTAPIEQAQQVDFKSDPVLRFTVPVNIGGHIRHFLIDTGAEQSGVSLELAESLRLPRGVSREVTGFAGTSSVPTVALVVRGIANHGARELTALAFPQDAIGADGFLGLDTLRGHVVVVFDFAQQRMLVRRAMFAPGGFDSGPEGVADMSLRKSRLVFSAARMNGVHVQALLDTGSSISVGNNALKQELLRRHKYGTPIAIRMLAVTGEQVPAEWVTVKDLWIGEIHVHNMPIAFAGRQPFDQLGLDAEPALLLGMDVLRQFDRVAIDFVNNQVWFTAKPSSGAYLNYNRNYGR